MKSYKISTGRSRLEMDWHAKEVTWEQLTKHLGQCKRTPESFKEYQAMTKEQKGSVKDIGGFVGGTLNGGQRKASTITARSLVTLDIDYGREDTIDTVDALMAGTAWYLYSTHSHSSASPRYRLIVPLSREVTPDEYIPIARRIAEQVDINIFDDSTYQPERLMYWPSASRDAEFVCRGAEGDPADADALLGTYADWRDVSTWPVSKRVQKLTAGHGSKQEDPTTKPGIIGAFCRCYSISEAIAKFLPDVYEPTGHADRYTFVGGTTQAGAIVYEDKYLYSHHGTDPCCEREVNAFDLVRIHKFGNLDDDSNTSTPVNKLPSFREMSALAEKDPKVHGLLLRERLTEINGDFGGMFADEDGDDSWLDSLDKGKKGDILITPKNLSIIFRQSPAFKGAVRYDTFRDKCVVTRDLPWRTAKEGQFWGNGDDLALLVYLSRTYNINTNKTMVIDTMEDAIKADRFHPVRDYLNNLPEWDGTERLDSIFIDYLGAQDTELIRAVTRKQFVAAVARVFNPGCKFDNILTLTGPEGVGKSTIIRAMGRDWYDDSFSTGSIGDKEAMEQVHGRWLIELGELKDYKKSTVEAFKSFISKQDDTFRPAYGRKVETYLRQCVFFATTNETAFLKGDTGNRRFWVVEVMMQKPKLDVFSIPKETIDQLWAEALKRYRDGEKLYLPSNLEARAREAQADYNEIAADERMGIIADGIRRHLPLSWWSLTRQQRKEFYRTASIMADDEPYTKRTTICAAEVQEEILGVTSDRYRNREIVQILKRLGFESIGVCKNKGDREYGAQRRYKIPDSFYDL